MQYHLYIHDYKVISKLHLMFFLVFQVNYELKENQKLIENAQLI